MAVNGREVALFYYRDRFYAVNDKCPHYGEHEGGSPFYYDYKGWLGGNNGKPSFFSGGPLHMGDIEELGSDKSPGVVCPWHKWCFELKTGKLVRPVGENQSVETYPVAVGADGVVSVGFKCFDPSTFTSEDF